MAEIDETRPLTDEECVSVLRGILEWYSIFPRGSTKSHIPQLMRFYAISRAIEVLEEKGEKNDNKN